MRYLLLTLARSAAVAMILVTPWLYGGTPLWTIELISQCLLIISALACVGWLVAWRWPRIGWVLPVSLVLLALGWASALYPRSRFDEMLMLLFPIDGNSSLGAWFQGSVDGERSIKAMRRLTGLLGMLWIARDMASNTRWRRAIIWTVIITGMSVAIHGLIQKSAGDIFGYWQGVKLPQTVFAGFWYHANAAAMLNLTWPFAAALCLESFARKWNQLLRALLLLALLAILAGNIVNVSKGGHLIMGIQALLFASLALPAFLRSVTGREQVRKMLFLTLGLLTFAGLGLAFFFGTGQATKRWEEMTWERFAGGDSRFDSMHFCWSELPHAGWQGYGPGTFEAVFLDVGTTNPERVPKHRWRFAHQDTLQTMVEWGWIGGSLWITLGLGLLAQSLIRLRKLRHSEFSSRYTQQAAIVTSLVGVALHAQADFPLQILGVQVLVAFLAGLGSQKALK